MSEQPKALSANPGHALKPCEHHLILMPKLGTISSSVIFKLASILGRILVIIPLYELNVTPRKLMLSRSSNRCIEICDSS